MDQEIEKISKKLMKELDEDRYRHTQGVMYTSAALAMRYGADLKKALLAGLLHDCAKCIPGHTKIKMCEKIQSGDFRNRTKESKSLACKIRCLSGER